MNEWINKESKKKWEWKVLDILELRFIEINWCPNDHDLEGTNAIQARGDALMPGSVVSISNLLLVELW